MTTFPIFDGPSVHLMSLRRAAWGGLGKLLGLSASLAWLHKLVFGSATKVILLNFSPRLITPWLLLVPHLDVVVSGQPAPISLFEPADRVFSGWASGV
jgi:hypothetical protein